MRNPIIAALNAPLLPGVTVLTSSNRYTLAEIGCETNVGAQVERLANFAVKAGLRGLVCSPLEIVALRKILPAHIQLVTPGIRTGAEKSRRPEAHALAARGHCRRSERASDWPADLCGGKSARSGGEDFGINLLTML